MSGSKPSQLVFLLHIVIWPFLIGAAFHFFGGWVGWPTLFLGGVMWFGSFLCIKGEE